MDTKLIIRVESQGAKQATTDLAALEAQGARTERATDALAATTKASGETAEQASARIKAMVAASLAQQSAAKGATAAQLAATTANETATEAVVTYSAATRARIAAQDAAMGSLQAFVGAEAETAAAAMAATGAIAAETEAVVGLKLASGGAVREYTALLDEILSGRTGRTPGTLAVLGTRLGLTQKLFSATGLAVLGTVAAVGAFLDIMAKAEEEDEQFNNAMERTGGYLGVTQGQFRAMATDIAAGNATIGQAKEALLAVANTGQFTGAQIEQIGTAAIAMSRVTGTSVANSVKEFVELGKDPVDAIVKLNSQYHFLTASVFDQIRALDQEGKTREASELAQETAAKAFDQRAKDMEANLGSIQTAWRGVEKAASSAWDAILAIGRKETPEHALATLKANLQELEHPSAIEKAILAITPGGQSAAIAYTKAQIEATQKLVDTKEQDAAATAKQAQANDDAIAATQKYGTSDKATQDLIKRAQAMAAQMANETLPGLKTPEIHLDSIVDPPKPAELTRATDQFTKLGQTFGETLRTSIGDYFSGINTDWRAMLRRMAIEAATSQIFSLFASFTGPVGAAAKFLGFGGSHDAGGYIPGGTLGLVGEVGPELVAGPAQVISRRDTAQLLSSGSARQGDININVDARGATDPAAIQTAVARGVAAAVNISDARVSARLRTLARPAIA